MEIGSLKLSLVKVRCGRIRVGWVLTRQDWCPYEKRECGPNMHSGRMPEKTGQAPPAAAERPGAEPAPVGSPLHSCLPWGPLSQGEGSLFRALPLAARAGHPLSSPSPWRFSRGKWGAGSDVGPFAKGPEGLWRLDSRPRAKPSPGQPEAACRPCVMLGI